MKTLIIDGNNLIHRTWWTAKNQAKRSEDVNISNLHIYFTLNAIFSYVNKYKPTSTIVVWDEKPEYQVNARKVEYKGYKGNRSKDSSPYDNNDAIKLMLSYLGLPSIFPRELEADDIVAYICKTRAGSKIIASVDRDFLQLVSDEIILFDPIRKIEFTRDAFEEMTGYAHDDWLVAKCLQGDSSDNVPGVKGFGKVTIQKYLNGDVTLTEEQQELYNKNLSLFSLDKVFKEHPEELVYYENQLVVEVEPSWSLFLEECKTKDFSRILNNEQTWYSLFFAGPKLQSLLG
jgi:DNA polymerase-1